MKINLGQPVDLAGASLWDSLGYSLRGSLWDSLGYSLWEDRR